MLTLTAALWFFSSARMEASATPPEEPEPTTTTTATLPPEPSPAVTYTSWSPCEAVTEADGAQVWAACSTAYNVDRTRQMVTVVGFVLIALAVATFLVLAAPK